MIKKLTKIEGDEFAFLLDEACDDALDEPEDDCDDIVDVWTGNDVFDVWTGNDSPTDESLTQGVSSPSEKRESQW